MSIKIFSKYKTFKRESGIRLNNSKLGLHLS
jgi:hypothetical protein